MAVLAVPLEINVAVLSSAPEAVISEASEFVYVGQLVYLYGNSSRSSEGKSLKYHWQLTKVPAGSSSSKLTPLLDDESSVSLVPDKVGIYEVELYVDDGLLSSQTIKKVFVARQLNIPTGQAYTPDMTIFFSFLRNWIDLVEDKERIEIFWSAATQLAAESLLRLYETNLSKSIRTIPEITQRRWEMLRLRVDLPETQQLSFHRRRVGNNGFNPNPTASESVVLEQPVPLVKDRVMVFDGTAALVKSSDSAISYVNDLGAAVEGTRVSFTRAVAGGSKHAYWWAPTGTVRFETDTPYLVRCMAGDLLALEMRLGTVTALIKCRIYGVTQDGHIGFEITPSALSDADDLYRGSQGYKSEVLEQVEDALFSLDIDPAGSSFRELASLLLDKLLIGDLTYITDVFGISFKAKYVLRLSRFNVDSSAITIPTLQSNVLNPVFILRQNEDYLLQQDADGMYVQLADSVLLDEGNPPRALWAESMYLDNAETIENNFGILVGGEREKLPTHAATYEKYKGAVAGLMYAFTNGPTPDNIRLGVQVVLGLPFTIERGIVRLVDQRYTDTHGLIAVEDVNPDDTPNGLFRLYQYPLTAQLETNETTGAPIAVDDLLPRFIPLCTGVSVHDWVNDPTWWIPIHDSKVPMPKYFEAFFEHDWYPSATSRWPHEAEEAFQEPQKVHTFEVRLDPSTMDTEDVLFAKRFVRGVFNTWRVGLEKKGIRPHYADPLFILSKELEDQNDIRDEVLFELQKLTADGTAGYEADLRKDHYNGSSNLLVYQDAPLRASRSPYRLKGGFEPPEVGGTSIVGTVRLDVDVHGGSFSVGDTISNGGGQSAEIRAIEDQATKQPNSPVTHTMLVEYTGDYEFDPDDEIEGATTADLCTIVNQTAAEFRVPDFDFRGATDDTYHRVRYGDILFIDDPDSNKYYGRYRIFRIHPDHGNRLILGQLRTDDPTAQPPLPYGVSDPDGSSSYNPLVGAEREAWQQETATYLCQVERPFQNPIHSPELYLQDPEKSKIDLAVGASPFSAPLAQHIHQDNFRSSDIVQLKDSGGAEHLEKYEILRLTDGSDENQLDDLDAWEPGSSAPSLLLRGKDPTAAHAYYCDIHDPRLPYPVVYRGTLPSQPPGPSNKFEVVLPNNASPNDGTYHGCFLRATGGSGAWGPGNLGHWYIRGYDGAARTATLRRAHRNVFADDTDFEIVSFRPQDQARPVGVTRQLFPADQMELFLQGPVKMSMTPGTVLRAVSGSNLVTGIALVNMAPSKPSNGFLVANGVHPTDFPFEPGAVVEEGDIVIMTPVVDTPESRKLMGQIYTVLGPGTGGTTVTNTTFSVSPTPQASGDMYFTIYRLATAHYYEWDGVPGPTPNFVYRTGPHLRYNPIPEWSM